MCSRKQKSGKCPSLHMTAFCQGRQVWCMVCWICHTVGYWQPQHLNHRWFNWLKMILSLHCCSAGKPFILTLMWIPLDTLLRQPCTHTPDDTAGQHLPSYRQNSIWGTQQRPSSPQLASECPRSTSDWASMCRSLGAIGECCWHELVLIGLGGFYGSLNIHMNTRTQGFPLKYCTVATLSVSQAALGHMNTQSEGENWTCTLSRD